MCRHQKAKSMPFHPKSIQNPRQVAEPVRVSIGNITHYDTSRGVFTLGPSGSWHDPGRQSNRGGVIMKNVVYFYLNRFIVGFSLAAKLIGLTNFKICALPIFRTCIDMPH